MYDIFSSCLSVTQCLKTAMLGKTEKAVSDSYALPTNHYGISSQSVLASSF